MTAAEASAGVLLAGVALFGLGLPLAWLGPAPHASRWVFRVAAAPLYAIALGWPVAVVLGLVGVALNPMLLAGMIVVAWGLAWHLTRQSWRIRESMAAAVGPALMVVTSAILWVLTLTGFGLYLPNRDFKNHAYFVAQVAWTQSADPELVMRASPLSDPLGGAFYPLGLHTLLGWALPSAHFPSVAITASAAVLVTSVSLPLGVVVLARQWHPSSPGLWWVAGYASIFSIGLTGAFQVGSVVLLCAAALYVPGLAMLWMWVRQPDLSTTVGLVVALVGLLALHVAEAVGLVTLALVCLPRAWQRMQHQRPTRSQMTAGAIAAIVGMAVAVGVLTRLLSRGLGHRFTDIQPNELDIARALGAALLQQPEGALEITVVWTFSALAGFWIAARQRLSAFPVVAFAVPVALGTLCGVVGIPVWLDFLTAPWYGSAARVGLMLMGPVFTAGALFWIEATRVPSRRALRICAAVGLAAILVALVVQVTPTRRADLASALAGAGDTRAVAEELASRLEPGQTVLNFEGDGSANLFAFARIPVLSGRVSDPAVDPPGEGDLSLLEQLHRLDDPEVQERMSELQVGFVAIGTTSRYWDAQAGFIWQQLLSQPQLSVELTGTDLVILRYTPGGG